MTFPNPFSASDPLDAATLNAIVNLLYNNSSANINIYFGSIFPDEVLINNGNAISLEYDSGPKETYGFQDTSAIDDEWQHGMLLSADTYTLTLRALKTSASGILKIYIDDVLEATFDLYAASNSASTETQASISLAAGWHTLRGVVDSQNGSSSGYDARWAKLNMRGASL